MESYVGSHKGVTKTDPKKWMGSQQFIGDEQAPRLAPEKRDFMATYTLGATMRQSTLMSLQDQVRELYC